MLFLNYNMLNITTIIYKCIIMNLIKTEIRVGTHREDTTGEQSESCIFAALKPSSRSDLYS